VAASLHSVGTLDPVLEQERSSKYGLVHSGPICAYAYLTQLDIYLPYKSEGNVSAGCTLS
jgi:hypothetical protein